MFPGDAVILKGTRLQTTPMEFARMRTIEHAYEMGIVTQQVPFYLTHQQWAALLARNLDYALPKGWAAYPAQLYLDLLTGNANEMSADNFVEQSGQGQWVNDRSGNPALLAKEAVTLTYEWPLPISGSYLLTTDVAGGAQYYTWPGQDTQTSSTQLGQTTVTMEPIVMAKGIHPLKVTVPAGGKLANFKVTGPAFTGFAPSQGFFKDRVLRYQEMAECLGKILNLPESSRSHLDSLAAQLRAKGFVIGDLSQPALGNDGLKNAAWLRSLQQDQVQKPAAVKKSDKAKSYMPRSAVSPVLPAVVP